MNMSILTCSQCGEELNLTDECLCKGDSIANCICEYEHHHIGCCGNEDYLPANPQLNWKHKQRLTMTKEGN